MEKMNILFQLKTVWMHRYHNFFSTCSRESKVTLPKLTCY